MKKIINDPARLVDDMLDGVLAAHPGWVRRLDGDSDDYSIIDI